MSSLQLKFSTCSFQEHLKLSSGVGKQMCILSLHGSCQEHQVFTPSDILGVFCNSEYGKKTTEREGFQVGFYFLFFFSSTIPQYEVLLVLEENGSGPW